MGVRVYSSSAVQLSKLPVREAEYVASALASIYLQRAGQGRRFSGGRTRRTPPLGFIGP